LNDVFGFQAAFYGAAGVAILALVVMIPVHETRLPRKQPSLAHLIKVGKRRDVFIPTAMNTIAQVFVWSTTFGFLPILASESLGASSLTISLLTSLNIFIGMVGNLSAAPLARRLGNTRLVFISFLILGAGTLLCAGGGSLAVLFLAQVFLGFGGGVNYPLLLGMSIEKVDENERGTAMGIHQAVYSIGIFTGPWLSGILADAFGMPAMFVMITILCTGMIAALVMVMVRSSQLP